MKETKQFQTESKELLSLMINSIYSNKEIFLRELVSNASDAIDKYRYKSIQSAGKMPTLEHEIWISLDKKKRTLTISDNGIGMNKDDLVNNLGTIAKSGSKDFIQKLKDNKDKEDINIIGQFGVGFYSAFMVAKKIEVETKTFGGEGYRFSSNGVESYTIESIDKETTGTTITLFLKKDEKEESYDNFLETWTVESLIKKYSDYVRYPIKMDVTKSVSKKDKDGKDIEGKYDEVIETKVLNSMIPLWKKNKNEVKDEELNEFYKTKFYDYQDPFTSLFINVDGMISYNALVYIPSHTPQNLYSDTYEKGLDLYAKGIFIKDKCKELVPDYLKFIRGVVDSNDFSLNISREILQSSPLLKRIADNIETKVISKLKTIKDEDFDKYVEFFKNFGDHLKFGIYSSYGQKKELLQDLLIYHSLNNEKLIDLKTYKTNMVKDQKYIYFASGKSVDAIKLLPQIEKYKKNGIDVLLLADNIDEFSIMMLRDYDKVEFKNISEDNAEELSKEEKERIDTLTSDNKRIIDNVKEALVGKVDDVILSNKLVDSPVCISTKDGMSLNMENVLKEDPSSKGQDIKATKVLEINPDHDVFKAIVSLNNDDEVKKFAILLYDEAMMLEGYDGIDKKEFIELLNALMIKAAK